MIKQFTLLLPKHTHPQKKTIEKKEDCACMRREETCCTDEHRERERERESKEKEKPKKTLVGEKASALHENKRQTHALLGPLNLPRLDNRPFKALVVARESNHQQQSTSEFEGGQLAFIGFRFRSPGEKRSHILSHLRN